MSNGSIENSESWGDTQKLLAFTTLGGFMFIILVLIGVMYVPPKGSDTATTAQLVAAIIALVGALGGMAGSVITYYYGSSKSSRDKDATNAANATTIAAQAAALDKNGHDAPRMPLPPGVTAGLILVGLVTAALLWTPSPAAAQQNRHDGSATSGVVVQPEPKAIALPCDPLHLIPNCVTSAGPLTPDLLALWQKITTAAAPDLRYAKAMADAAGTDNSKLRSQCLAAVIDVNTQTGGANLKNPDGTPMQRPDPHLITDIETAAEVIDQMQPSGKLMSQCAAAALAAGQNVAQFINALVIGAAVIPK